jgi:Right handed beta helix region
MRFGSLNVRALGIVVAAIVVLAAPGAGSGSPGSEISSCGQTVTTNAFLIQDLSCTGNGVIVGAAKITIDLRGFTLRGDGGAPDSGIVDNGFDSVKLENGVVRNFGSGLAIDGANKASVANVVVSGANIGIYVNGDSATITSSTASGNGLTGVQVIGASASIVSSTASGNLVYGFDLEGPSASIKSSTAFGNGNDGFFIHGVSDSTSVASSTATSNGISGFEIYGDSVSIKSSVASGNVTRGIFIQGDGANVTGNRTDANGFKTGESDDIGLGINVNGFTTPPRGTNSARGNDNTAECAPLSLC